MVKSGNLKRGDIVWINLNPTKGHEQRGKRPAIILSPEEYHKKTGLALVCPITSQKKDYPFEISINQKIKGVILADQVRTIDLEARDVQFIEKSNLFPKVKTKLMLLL